MRVQVEGGLSAGREVVQQRREERHGRQNGEWLGWHTKRGRRGECVTNMWGPPFLFFFYIRLKCLDMWISH